MTEAVPLPLEYVLPLKLSERDHVAELAQYLSRIVRIADVTVVATSSRAAFDRLDEVLPPKVRRLHADPLQAPGRNGKVVNVLTGLAQSRHERVVIADDDVRYEAGELERMNDLLARFDVVRPQNYFSSLPWHARWDTARTLINRAFGSDFPGTLGVRKSVLERTRGYRADVLFENLELIRTVRAAAGTECRADDLLVARNPPDAKKFLSQRVRQAYDDFAQPFRLVGHLLLLPALLASAAAPMVSLALFSLSIVFAEVGRRRAGGRAVFPPSSALWAPLWLVERAVCVWAAVVLRARGGVRYAGNRIYHASSSQRMLARSLEKSLP